MAEVGGGVCRVNKNLSIMFGVWKKRFDMEEDYFTKDTLQRFNLKTLRTIVKEMKSEVQRISQHLVHTLVEKDKVAKRTEDKLDRVSEILSKYAVANGLKSNFKFYLKFSSFYDDSEYRKWRRSWSLISQLDKGIIKEWRRRVWEGVVMYSTRDICWDRVFHHLYHEKASSREKEWKEGVHRSLKQLGSTSVDHQVLERVLVSYCRLFPQSVYCPEFATLAAIALTMTADEHLSLQVLVTLLEHKLPPHYFAEGFHSVKSDILVLTDLIQHFLPQLFSHMKLLRSKSTSKISKRSYSSVDLPTANECMSHEPPLVDALSLQWLLSFFTSCLSWKIIKRVFSSLLIDGSDILLYTALAIWMLMESELIQTTSVPNFYEKASGIITQLKNGTYIEPTDFIQIVYTLRQCAKTDAKVSVKKLRKKHSHTKLQRLTPVCPPPSQGGNFTMTPICPPPSQGGNITNSPVCPPPSQSNNSTMSPVHPSPKSSHHPELSIEAGSITALAECPQTKRSGFVFSYAYAADVPADLPVRYALKMSRHCNELLKNGTTFNMGEYTNDTNSSSYLFKDLPKIN